MSRRWITNGSTTIAPVVNPLAAACHDGYLPTEVVVLSNPDVARVTETAASLIRTVVTAHGGEEPTVRIEELADERDFEAIIAFLNEEIAAGQEAGDAVAVDVTPGRKFWSIISFRAGEAYDVEHLYYVHLDGAYFGESFPTIPRSAIELIDFAEVF